MKEYYKAIWKEQFTLQALIIAVIMLFIPLFNNPALTNISGMMFFILIFTVFDVMGYGNVFDLIPTNKEKKEVLYAYRFLQNTFMIILLAFIYYHFSYIAVIAGIIAWWLTFCDYLYYILLFKKLDDYGDYFWLKGWSIFMVYKLFGWKVSRTWFIIFAYLGLMVGVGVCL